MTSKLGLGTHLGINCLSTTLQVALRAGCSLIDTAPNYGRGQAHSLVNRALQEESPQSALLTTKVGFLPSRLEREEVLSKSLCTPEDVVGNHVLTPEYIAWRIKKNLAELGRPPDITFLHNPERQLSRLDRRGLIRLLDRAFLECEKLVQSGLTRAYGVATWSGLFQEISTLELIERARRVAGENNHLSAIQLPVSLIQVQAAQAALENRGPIPEAKANGLHVYASSPLGGGTLPKMINQEFIELTNQKVTAAQSALLFARSVPGIDRVLVSCSKPSQFTSNQATFLMPALDTTTMNRIIELIT